MSLDTISSSPLHTQPASLTTHSVPVEHLDYKYIEKCSDLKYLEKILGVLRSGKEGIYPHLTEFCEKHIEKLDPRSRALRKENFPATSASFSKDEWDQITNELQTWENEIKINDVELNKQLFFCNDVNIPPVRGSNLTYSGDKAYSKTCHLPRSYQDWDKFDVEKECAKIDETLTTKESAAIIDDSLLKIQSKIDTTGLTEQEKVVLANREKDKGNEAFRAGDYEEAVTYYTRSVYIMPMTTAYNNRAQAEIKLQRWYDVLSDCERVLQLEPHNTKALLRRATAYKQLENLQMAHDDINAVLRSEPNNMNLNVFFLCLDIDSPEDLCILYSNRAACYLKDGNSSDCIADCSRALELQPFSLKPLLRRAMAYESLERYRKAYVDYKTALQIDSSIQAAHDSVNRITRLLIEQDGAEWRQKLPEIPAVPVSLRQHHTAATSSTHLHKENDTQEARFTSLKTEGNELVKKGQYQEAVGKYSECLKLKSDECAIFTNRALCFIKLKRFAEAKQDCNSALNLESSNKKAFYRRALANKGLKACSSDLQEVLRLDTSVQEAQQELDEVTALLKQQRATGSPSQPRRDITITEVEDDDEEGDAVKSSSDGEQKSTSQTINLQPSNAYEFGQALNAARSLNDTAACAQLLRTVPPDSLPQYVSTQLDGHTLSFIMKTLDTHLLASEPGVVYQLLDHLHTTERFSMVLMMLNPDERRQMTQLFEHLCSVDCEDFSQNDIKNLANKYI
uniref:Sperm associated antigen 1 n=1 Tax=Astyanax mexicanus TaxID=7994 RepID=A0A8B9LJ07_ASTMX